MKIAIGCDHRGFGVKTKLIELVSRLGHEVTDVGSFGEESCDYPDLAADRRTQGQHRRSRSRDPGLRQRHWHVHCRQQNPRRPGCRRVTTTSLRK